MRHQFGAVFARNHSTVRFLNVCFEALFDNSGGEIFVDRFERVF